MSERQNKKLPGMFGRLMIILGVFLLMSIIYVSAILLQSPMDERADSYVVKEEPEAVTRMQPAAMNDANELARMFGAPLPYLPGYAMTGEGTNANYEGAVARLATMRYSGITVSAVRPAAAASLLLHGELSVAMQNDLTILHLPAMLAEKGQALCVYFSSNEASYAIYAPQAEKETFLSLLGQLEWAEN